MLSLIIAASLIQLTAPNAEREVFIRSTEIVKALISNKWGDKCYVHTCWQDDCKTTEENWVVKGRSLYTVYDTCSNVAQRIKSDESSRVVE